MRRRGANRIVNLGDSLSGPLLPRETAQYLMACRWLNLPGNHERQLLTHGPLARLRNRLDWEHALLTGYYLP